ncbi:hypothetical protein GTY77_26940, partial [Streptomyces sp. SID8380]|nr:hypothetical protein [Streptomyces sp. SID8380]
ARGPIPGRRASETLGPRGRGRWDHHEAGGRWTTRPGAGRSDHEAGGERRSAVIVALIVVCEVAFWVLLAAGVV